jgi:hypothetical protein
VTFEFFLSLDPPGEVFRISQKKRIVQRQGDDEMVGPLPNNGMHPRSITSLVPPENTFRDFHPYMESDLIFVFHDGTLKITLEPNIFRLFIGLDSLG